MTNSRVISVRLNAGDLVEQEALAIYDDLVGQGYSPRQIFTDAILRLAGMTPEMFSERQLTVMDIATRLNAIRNELIALRSEQADGLRELMKKMKAADPSGFRSFANEADEDSTIQLSDDFIMNARKAMRPSFRQSRDE